MTTTRIRAIVSRASRLAAWSVLTSSLALGACAPHLSPSAASAPAPERRATMRFENEARTHVYVYLVGEQREWLLGRVEPGARALLRVPDAALTETGFVRLAVIPDAPVSVAAARDPNSTFTIAQPASSIVSQQWTFSTHAYTAPEIFGVRAPIGRR
jgi:hypothetical protein